MKVENGSGSVSGSALDAGWSSGIPLALGCWRLDEYCLAWRGVVLSSVCWDTQEKGYRASWTCVIVYE